MINIENCDCFDLLSTLQDKSIGTICIDPPYGYLEKHQIETNIDIPRLANELYRVLDNDSFCVIFGIQPTLTKWIQEFLNAGFLYKNELIWNKNNGFSLNSKVVKIHENIIIFTKGNANLNEVKLDYLDIIESSYLINSKGFSNFKCMISHARVYLKRCLEKDKIDNLKSLVLNKKNLEKITKDFRHVNDKIHRKIGFNNNMSSGGLYNLIHGRKPFSIVSYKPHNLQKFNKEEFNVKHPTVKPIELIKFLLRLTINKDSNKPILDCFLGSGTTAIACKELNLNFIGCELLKEYYDMCLKRTEDFKLQETE